jgi:hypothetical protein
MAENDRSRMLETIRDKEIELAMKSEGKMAAARLPEDVQSYRALLRDLNLTELQRRFLAAFSVCGIVTRAALASGIAPTAHYSWLRSAKNDYKIAYDNAVQIANEFLEGMALELATGMRQEPVVSAGKLVTYKDIYDTRLLTTLLKARMPDKYGNKVDVTSNGHSIVKVIDKDTYDSI